MFQHKWQTSSLDKLKKTRKFAKLTVYLSIFFVFIFITACNQNVSSTSNSVDNIRIGVALAQTSNIALLGQESVSGAKIAEEYFQANHSFNNLPIKLIFQDTGGDEAGAINAFQTLIATDRVVGIIGPSSSQQAFSADPVADRAQVPVIGPSNTAKGIPEIGKYISRVSAPISQVAPTAIKAALRLNPNLQKVAIFYAQNDAFTKSETEIFQQAVKNERLNLITTQRFQTTDTDFQIQATNAINLNPDLVIISGLAADGGNLIRQIRELGYKKIIVGGNGLNTSNIFAVCKALCDGVLIAQAYSPNYDSEINRTFRTMYRARYLKEPPQFSAQAFSAVQVFMEALQTLERSHKVRQMPLPELRTALNQQILAGKYNTPLGEISFTSDGEVIQKNFYVAQIEMQDGERGKFNFLAE
ncbi:MAG: branched-chain amino acid ABC transporter substrate-binding protein [Pseudanabaena sp.]|nr:MAG: branched-chain amino acid ABC transporter substrate-binding protein [Pseudanabaena sp.]